MEKVIVMSEAEYMHEKELFAMLESAMLDLEDKYSFLQKRCKKLWDALNRPVIEATTKKHEEEFYFWCEQKSNEYEEQDYKNWCACRAKFYNNGIKNYCECHGITEEEAEEDRKWNEARDYIWPNEESERWAELNPCKTGSSWILSKALDSIKKRERIAILEGNKEDECKYRDMWLNWYHNMTNDEIGDAEYLR